MKKLTVFTPTYNRGYILSKCYDALVKQTNKDFIWMIVDDGSTDNTKELIDSYIKEKKIEIQYVYKNNGGKYTAVNEGIINCKTELFSFVDSDDYYLPNTVQIFLDYWNKYSENNIAGIIGRRCNPDFKIMGNLLEYKSNIVNFTKFSNTKKFIGDTCRMYKTSILKENLYPQINDKFIPENVMLGKIDEKYNVYFLNEALSVSEYLEDGYTKSYKELLRNNPVGYKLSLEENIRNEKNIARQIKLYISYITWCKRNKLIANKKYNYIFFLSYVLSLICLLLGIPTWHTPKRGLINKIKIYLRILKCYLSTFGGIKAKIYNDDETIAISNKYNKSIIRFGDGEFNIILGENIEYQRYSEKLSQNLLTIIKEYDCNKSNYILCIPKFFFQSTGIKLMKKRAWISSWSFSRYFFKKNCDLNKEYGDAFIFHKGNSHKYSKLWNKNKYQKCIFIHNNERYAQEFEKQYKISTIFIKAPTKNAFQKIDEIENNITNEASKYAKENLIIIVSMGPAAKILVYNLCDKYRIIDAGHCFDNPLEKGD